jgi:hypothetical protein
MLSFLLEEGIITVGTLSGLFTAAMLNSFRMNILDPGIETMFPSEKLDVPKSKLDSASQIIMDTPSSSKDIQIKWQTFLRDFITWLFVMGCLYLFWKHVLHKYKKN